MGKQEEIYNINDQDVQLLPIRFETNNQVNGMLQNLAEKREMMIGKLKHQPNLQAKYKPNNNLLFKLMKFNWMIMLTNEI